jgi:hypothetical protein
MTKAIGELIDEMHDVREQRREIAKEDKTLKATYDELEHSLISALEATGQTSGASDIATASVKKTIVADVQDWDRFHAWMRKTNRLYMLERRPSQLAFREFLESTRGHKPPPGVQKFELVSISLRNK